MVDHAHDLKMAAPRLPPRTRIFPCGISPLNCIERDLRDMMKMCRQAGHATALRIASVEELSTSCHLSAHARNPTSWSSRSRARPASTIFATARSATRSTSSSRTRVEPLFAVDLAKVDYLSSSGVAILVGLKRRVETKGGKIVIYHVQPIVRDLLAVMKLDRFFMIADDEAEAIASLRPLPTA